MLNLKLGSSCVCFNRYVSNSATHSLSSQQANRIFPRQLPENFWISFDRSVDCITAEPLCGWMRHVIG